MAIRHCTRCFPPGRMSGAVRRIVVACLLVPALAGAASSDLTQIGLHAGLSVPSIKGGTNEMSRGYTSRLGSFFGLFADYGVRPHVSLRAEINYSSQGGQRNGMQPISVDPSLGLPPGMELYAAFDNETILDYIEIPLKVKMTTGETMRFFIDAGPYVGFLARAKTVTRGWSLLYVDASGTPLTLPPDYEPLPPIDFAGDTDVTQDINRVNAGITGGMGMELPFGPGDLVLDAHFSLGLTNIQKDTELNGKNQTGAVELGIGYSYPLNRSR
jgi:hypothetical protein